MRPLGDESDCENRTAIHTLCIRNLFCDVLFMDKEDRKIDDSQ